MQPAERDRAGFLSPPGGELRRNKALMTRKEIQHGGFEIDRLRFNSISPKKKLSDFGQLT